MSMANTITLLEYDFVHSNKDLQHQSQNPKAHYVTRSTLNNLKLWIAEHQQHSQTSIQILGLDFKRGFGVVVQVLNHVGLIQTKDGTVLEILPKVTKRSTTTTNQDDIATHQQQGKKILLNMLCALPDTPFKNTQQAQLKSDQAPLLEVFITLFLQQLSVLVGKGLRSDYQTIQAPKAPFLKGKLQLNQQLLHNHIDHSKFAVHFQQLTTDILPNQLIKAALQKVQQQSKDPSNQQTVLQMRSVFDQVSNLSISSQSAHQAFQKLHLNRQFSHYHQVLNWCQLLLLGNSISPYQGNTHAVALLFDMNSLFERYVYVWLKRHYPNLKVSAQHQQHFLAYQLHNHSNNGSLQKSIQKRTGRFRLKPDLVINDGRIILDTKWKAPTNNQARTTSSHIISQADAYQMHAYASCYQHCQQVILVYPYQQGSTTETLWLSAPSTGQNLTSAADQHSRPNKQLCTAFFDVAQPLWSSPEHQHMMPSLLTNQSTNTEVAPAM